MRLAGLYVAAGLPEWTKLTLYADTQRRGDRHFFVFLMPAGVLVLPVSFWLPIGIMAVVAFWGDRIELLAQLRLVIQLGLMAVVIVSGGGGAAYGGRQYLLLVGFRTVFIVGTANYYNFMDGIKGIAGITGLFFRKL